jgi:pimeloyl-ACP methyl ester carboxylesterase
VTGTPHSAARASRGSFVIASRRLGLQEGETLGVPDLVYFNERGTGPPLLLVHGLMVSGDMFESVLDHFARGHRVIVPDLRGHGRSRNLPPPYTARQLASDLSRLLDHLGVDKASILGYSQGGAIAQQLVLDDPARCDGLVLACTYAYNMATRREWLEGHLAPVLIRVLGMRRMAKLAISQSLLGLDAKQARWLVEVMAAQDQSLMLTAWRETMSFDSRPRLGEIACPTLILAGSNDRGVPIHHAEMLHEGIAESRLVVIDGADHALLWTHTDEFLRTVDEFLDRR